MVTGASDGIGKEYAIQLARDHRLNIVLISRSLDKLQKVQAEIGKRINVRFHSPALITVQAAEPVIENYSQKSQICGRQWDFPAWTVSIVIHNPNDLREHFMMQNARLGDLYKTPWKLRK